MGIQITVPKTKVPRAMKLASHITSYLFEEQYDECTYFKESEIKSLRAAAKALGRVANRTAKTK